MREVVRSVDANHNRIGVAGGDVHNDPVHRNGLGSGPVAIAVGARGTFEAPLDLEAELFRRRRKSPNRPRRGFRIGREWSSLGYRDDLHELW